MMLKFLKYTLILFVIASFTIEAKSQESYSVLDGAYVRETNLTKRVIPYPYLREADVMYVRRVWQEMDLKQKINHPYYFPTKPIRDRKNLFDVIKQGLLIDGSLVAYSIGVDGEDDEFKYALDRDSVESILNPLYSQPIEDDETGEVIGFEMVPRAIPSEDIKRYRIKEDWIWDRQRSERYIRIVGIAPLKEEIDEEGESKGFKPLFWLYYPECRYVFANADVFNLFNDAQRRTYEDLFQKRYFSSYIVKEQNVYDRKIIDYAREQLDALAEAEKIKEELFLLEHDLWHY